MARRTDHVIAPAETAYLFSHGALRDAAYQLIPVSQRARLHGLALDILEETLGASLDAVPALADHARDAQVGVTFVGSELPLRELRYLRLSALHAAGKFENDSACRYWERVADHPSATVTERCEALASAGVTHWMLGRSKPALRCLSAAIENRQAEPRRVIFCLIERGTLYRDLRDYPQATRDLTEALSLARRIGDKHLQLRALGNLCTTQDDSMTHTGARDLYAPVLKLAREIGDTRAVGISEGQIGLACIRGAKFVEAEKHLAEAIRLLRESGDKLNEATMLSAMGRLLRVRTDGDRAANLQLAAQHYQAALAATERLGYLFQRSSPLAGLAATHRALGQRAEALALARQALHIALEVGDPIEVDVARNELNAALASRQ